MTRDQLLAELLVERFGPIQREWVAPVVTRLAAVPDFPIVHDFAEEPDEDGEPMFYDARPWTSRDAYADEMFDQLAA